VSDPGSHGELREPVAPMPREKSKGRPPRGERTNAEHGGGPTHTSEEGQSCGRSKGVGPSGCLQRPTGNRRRPWRQRSRRLLGGSGVSREAPAPFCERLGVKLLRPTRHSRHGVLDVIFRDDLSRLRKVHGSTNMALVRHFALNLVRTAPNRRSLKTRRKHASWDPQYLQAPLAPSAHYSGVRLIRRTNQPLPCPAAGFRLHARRCNPDLLPWPERPPSWRFS
jgi:hypothetical protein